MDELKGRGLDAPADELRLEAGDVRDDELDLELAELFSGAFDSIQASDELKASTLAAIFALADGADEGAVEGKVASAVEAAAAADSEPESTSELEFELLDGGKAARDEGRPKTRTHRSRSWRMRVAAAVVAVALATGGVAYATPASRVTVSSDDASVELGVNVFGRTVSVATDDDELQAALDQAGVRGAGYEEALDRVLDECDKRVAARGSDAADEGPAIEVSGPFAGEGSHVAQNVERVVQEHAERRAQAGAPQAEEPAAEASDMGEPAMDEAAGSEAVGPGAEPGAVPSEGLGGELGGAPEGEVPGESLPGGNAPDATGAGTAPQAEAPGESGPAGEQSTAPQGTPPA